MLNSYFYITVYNSSMILQVMGTFAWLEGICIEVVLRFITVDSGVLLATVDGTALGLQQSASNWGTLEF